MRTFRFMMVELSTLQSIGSVALFMGCPESLWANAFKMHSKCYMFIDASEHIMNCKWQRGRGEWRGFPIETLSSHDNCKYCKTAITQLCNIRVSSCYSEMFLNIFVLFICMIRGCRHSKCLWAPSLLQSLHTALAWACLFILLAACPNTTSRHTPPHFPLPISSLCSI